jgi:hypothetical protein
MDPVFVWTSRQIWNCRALVLVGSRTTVRLERNHYAPAIFRMLFQAKTMQIYRMLRR